MSLLFFNIILADVMEATCAMLFTHRILQSFLYSNAWVYQTEQFEQEQSPIFY